MVVDLPYTGTTGIVETLSSMGPSNTSRPVILRQMVLNVFTLRSRTIVMPFSISSSTTSSISSMYIDRPSESKATFLLTGSRTKYSLTRTVCSENQEPTSSTLSELTGSVLALGYFFLKSSLII